MTKEVHRLGGLASRKRFADPEWRKYHAECVRRAWKNPEVRKSHLEAIRRVAQDPKRRERISRGVRRAFQNPEVQKRHSDSVRRCRRDPKVRKRVSEGVRRAWKDPVFHAKMKAKLQARSQRPEYLKNLSAGVSKWFKDNADVVKKRCRNRKWRAKLSRAQKKAYREGRRVPCGACVMPHPTSYFERCIEQELCKRGVAGFISQFRIAGTRYCADLYFAKQKLIVEIDGHPSHYLERASADRRRDRRLRQLGFHILRLRRRDLRRGFTFCVAVVVCKLEEVND